MGKWVELPLDRMVKAGWNYKTEDDDRQKKLTENIKRNGQVESIIVRELDTEFFEVVNGNHRLTSFTEAGLKTAMCFNLGKISDAAAMRIAIETNETRFDTDNMRLASRIKEIAEEFSLADLEVTMPYTQEELEKYSKLSDFDWEAFEQDQEPPQQRDEHDDEFRTVSFRLPEGVADQLEEQVERFKRLLHPEEKLDDVSPVLAVEALCQCLAQLNDDVLI